MYHRILVKLSGEALAGNKNSGILDSEALFNFSKVLCDLAKSGTEVCVVVGAGNICRGAAIETVGFDRVVGDKMGMLGTVINSFALMNYIKNNQQNAVVLSAVPMETFTETYTPELADKYLKNNTIVIFGGGTGKPYFSTDTCATMRAIEVNCDAMLFAKNGVDGIYDDDPRYNKNATMYKEITCSEIIAKNLKVMDLTAVELLKDKNIDVRVFNIANLDNFSKVVKGEDVGTTIKRG